MTVYPQLFRNASEPHPLVGFWGSQQFFKKDRDGTSCFTYGFNGMEKDNELKGNGNSYDFGARMYDCRVGRWVSTDPLTKEYPHLSAYNFVAGNPISMVDPDGKRINWFRLRSSLRGRKALLSTPTGVGVWQKMRESGSWINVRIVNEVLTQPNGVNQAGAPIFNIVEGLTVQRQRSPFFRNPNNPSLRRQDSMARDGRGNLKRDKSGRAYAKSVDMFISIGTFNLEKDIEQNLGVNNFQALPPGQRQQAVQNQLVNGNYTVVAQGPNTNAPPIGTIPTTLVPVPNNAVVGLANVVLGMGLPPNIQVPLPNANETQAQFMNRISVHEGVHAYMDAHNATLPPPAQLNPEQQPYEKESDTIPQQQRR